MLRDPWARPDRLPVLHFALLKRGIRELEVNVAGWARRASERPRMRETPRRPASSVYFITDLTYRKHRYMGKYFVILITDHFSDFVFYWRWGLLM